MDEMVTYLTPREVLTQTIHVDDDNIRGRVNHVTVELAIEAIKKYHKQFEGEMPVPIVYTPPVLTLEEKIVEAKGYGVRFIKAQPTGQYQETPDAIIITEDMSTSVFENLLDRKIQYYRERVFIDILKKHDLLK